MVYHVINKSIAEFVIFNNEFEFYRMIKLMNYYSLENPPQSFSRFIEGKENRITTDFNLLQSFEMERRIVEIIAYCLMPTHLHLILNEIIEGGVSIFMGNMLNSYSRYFNIKHKRKGPLWQGRSKKVSVKSDEQLLHLTRYAHLNPVTAYIVNKPEEWPYSSYNEYLSESNGKERICKYNDFLDIKPAVYREFVEDGISYQRDLAKIKHLLLE